MKSFLTSVILLSSSWTFAAANVTHFVCMTDEVIEGKKPTKIEFSVTGLGSKKVEYYVEKDEDYPVKMTPESSVLMLNDNFGISENSKGLLLDSDGDGCQLTEVLLYRDSNYTHGYAKVKEIGGCGAENVYSKMTCSLQ